MWNVEIYLLLLESFLGGVRFIERLREASRNKKSIQNVKSVDKGFLMVCFTLAKGCIRGCG